MAYFSKNSADYASAINALKKPTYESKYNNLIENQLNKILNREDFSYDFNADPLYQNYKDQYTKLGKEASMNAAASASALTGGYGNSYAGTAASQANQQYLTQLNNQIPALMNAAMDRYKMQTEQLYNQFGALQQEEGRQYGQHRDEVSDYYSDWSNLESGYSTALQQEDWERDFAYRQERDKIADEQWQKNYDYNASRAGVSDSQWEKNFAYQQERDKVADEQWQKNYELALRKARSGGSGSGSSKKTSGALSNGYEPDYTSKNYAATIRELVNTAYNSNDYSADLVDEYVSNLVKRKVLTQDEADQLYENAMYSYPQYRDRVMR
ncbi:MAG: hypothetical protein J6P79_01570 [Pseudobutyrivibrio sp.]|nr:hypothetical protein [Pseudobutyrivibrio sp.]